MLSGRMPKKRKEDSEPEAPQSSAADSQPIAPGLHSVHDSCQCHAKAPLLEALQANDFDATLHIFKELKDSWEIPSTCEAPSSAKLGQDELLLLAVKLACEKQGLKQLMPALVGIQMSEETINLMLTECIRTRDLESAQLAEWIARANQASLEDSTYVLLIKCCASSPGLGERIVKEVLWRASPKLSEDLALAILDFCSGSRDKEMADMLVQQMEPKPFGVLAELLRFYAVGDHYEEACGILEDYLPSFNGHYLQHPVTGMIDSSTGWSLVVAALKCGRCSLATHLLETAAASHKNHIVTIQKWWKHGHVKKPQTSSPKLIGMRDVSSRLSRVFQSASFDSDEDFPAPPLLEQIKKAESRHIWRTSYPDDSTSAGTLSDSDQDVMERSPLR